MNAQNNLGPVQDRYFQEWPGHRVGGNWIKTLGKGEEKASINPSRGTAILNFNISRETIQYCLGYAYDCHLRIKNFKLQDKSQLLNGFAKAIKKKEKELIFALQVEAGKPQWEAKEEVQTSIAYLEDAAARVEEIYASLLYPAHLGREKNSYSLESIGPIAAYLPFSTPVASFVSYLSAALLSGNPIIFFSSIQSAACSLILAGLDEGLDVPPGCFNVIFSGFEHFRQALGEPQITAAIYSGSKENCDEIKKLVRAPSRLLLECGGKNAALIHSTADVELGVKATVLGLCKSANQLCSSTSRVFVYRSLIDEFKTKLVQAVRQLRIGPTDGFDDAVGPDMGPLYSQKSVEKFLRFQTMARREAKETLCWGKAVESSTLEGYFVSPGVHLLDHFDPNSPYQRNVIFAPDLAVYTYDKLNDVIAEINTAYSIHSLSYIGDLNSLQERRHLLQVPNLIHNASTVEYGRALLPLAGRTSSSQHLYNGVAMALHLSFPQVVFSPLR